jgi:hypothetical protein
MSSFISIPYIIAFPLEELRMPVSIFNRVLLPAPLWPSNPKTSFSLIEKFKLSTALKPPSNCLVRPCIIIESEVLIFSLST